MMKKMLVLAMMLCLFALPALAAEELTVTIDTGASVTLKDGDNDGYYEIGTADELYAFAAAANGGRSDIDGELTADITVNENVLDEAGGLNGTPDRVWTPIGYYKSSSDCARYTGAFDGAGHTVSGLYYNDPDVICVGFFGYTYPGFSVRDVTVEDSWFLGLAEVGGILGGSWDGGSISGCTNAATVTGNGYVGGIAGGSYSAEISNCVNKGLVIGSRYNRNPYDIGGIAGIHTNGGRMEYCENRGEVAASYGQYVGGVVGNNSARIVASFNTAPVSGRERVGGVVGNNGGSISACYNAAPVSGNSYVGGVVGFIRSDVVENCYFDSTAFGGGGFGHKYEDGTAINVTGKTAEQFASGEVAYLLNGHLGETIFKQNLGIDAAPGFEGKTVYLGYGSCADKGYTNSENGTDEKPDHAAFGYAAYGNVIAYQCPVCKETSGTATITAEDVVYSGAAYDRAAVEDDGTLDGAAWEIVYHQGETALSGAPTQAGSYTASITRDGATAFAAFAITQSQTAMTAAADKTDYLYGETVTIAVTPKATGVSAYGLRARFDAPAAGTVSLWNGETQITEGKPAVNGQEVAFALDTVADGLIPGSYTLTAKYAASDDMAAQTATVSFVVAYAQTEKEAEESGEQAENGVYTEQPTLTAPEGCEISLTPDSWTGETDNAILLPAQDGEHTYTYYIRLPDGTIAEKTVTFTVDTTPPEVTEPTVLVDPTKATIIVPATDAVSGVMDIRIKVNSGEGDLTIEGNGDDSYTITGLIPGETYSFTLTVTDGAGHATTVTITITAPLMPALPQTGDASLPMGALLAMLMASVGMLGLLGRKKA